jgi:hypothetical protein
MTEPRQLNDLAARQKVITFPKDIPKKFSMWVMIVTLATIVSACHEKTNGQNSGEKKFATTKVDSLDKPKVNVQVNRRYDDKGNLIGFDSTYSSYYSNVQGDTSRMDSLMNNFDRFFESNHSSFFRNQFDPLFFNDSLRYPDFFHNDFFMKRYELNDMYMRNMMQRMDSIKNEFYRDHREGTDEKRETT